MSVKKHLVYVAMAAFAATACGMDQGESGADPTAGHEWTEPREFCFSEKLYLSGVWLDEPVFEETRTIQEEHSDGSVSRYGVTDVEGAAGDERAASASPAPASDVSVPDGLAAVIEASPTKNGPDHAFVISNVAGFHLGALVDVADGQIMAWTGCEEGWTDYTDVLTEWAETDDVSQVIERLKSVVRLTRADEGSEARAAETGRLWDLAMGVTDTLVEWHDRPAHSRSLVDADTPKEITERLATVLIRIDAVEAVNDADLVICPVQGTATSGYCFGIDALARAVEGSVIRIAVLPDEPLELLLGRESRWDEPGHEVRLGEVDGRTEAIDLRIKGTVREAGVEVDRALETVQINFEPIAREAVDLSGGVQYLGGIEPYEGN